MTIKQANEFYSRDEENYKIFDNINFLFWLRKLVKNGYDKYIDNDELQDLINTIASWYEIKYPERKLLANEGIKYINFEGIKDISEQLDIKQLIYRLSDNQLSLLSCDYRAIGSYYHEIIKDNGKKEFSPHIFLRIKYFIYGDKCSKVIDANCKTGEIENIYALLPKLKAYESISTLEELLTVLKEKYDGEVDFSELKECVYNHHCDIELRKRILQMVALKLLYSDKTLPERGYERAIKFINEFNKELNLNLSTEEIDNIMSQDYTKSLSLKEMVSPPNKPAGKVKSLFRPRVIKKENKNI